VKAGWFDGGLQARAAIFGSRYRDIQYAIPVSVLVDQPYSIQEASLQGADLDLSASPVKDLQIRADLAFLHWRVDRAYALAGTVFDPATGSNSPYAVGQNIRDLFSLPDAPKYNFSVGADWAFLHLERSVLSTHLDYAYRGGLYSDAASGPAVPGRQFDSVPAVGLLNARLTLAQETDWGHHVAVSLWGQNVLNRKYYVLAGGYGAGVAAFAANGVSPEGYTARAGAWAQPATYGLRATYEY
jgi:hypothetical protein